MDTGEAIDLVLTLPPGSLYVASVKPELSWPRWRCVVADLQDELWAIACARSGYKGDPPRVVRPADAVERAGARKRSAAARAAIEATEWVAID